MKLSSVVVISSGKVSGIRISSGRFVSINVFQILGQTLTVKLGRIKSFYFFTRACSRDADVEMGVE